MRSGDLPRAKRGARWPPPVRPGDRVGVAALSGPVDPRRLDAGLDALSGLGFDPVVAPNLRARTPLHAGTDDERLAGLDALLADEDLGAIFFARGGHGLLRLLPRLDWSRLARRPRAWIGYSDLTPLLNLIPQRLGTITFHGPMVAAEIADGLEPDEVESLLEALAGEVRRIPAREVKGPRVTGPLMGGCLSLLASVQGTPWAPDFRGRILFLEEVREPLYRFDRLLTHLELSGSLDGLQGLVIGALEGVGEDNSEATPEGILDDLAEARGWTRARGVEAGHGRPQRTLPLGAPVALGGGSDGLEILDFQP